MTAAGKRCSFDDAFARVWRRKTGFGADTVGTEESFRKVVSFQIIQCLCTDHSFSDGLDFTAEDEDLETLGSKTGCMGNAVRYIHGTGFTVKKSIMRKVVEPASM